VSQRRIRLPADVELEDRLAFGLTARQLVILAVTAIACYASLATLSSLVPLPLACFLVTPLGLSGVALALGRRDGLSGDRLALAAARHLSQPARRVAAPEGLPAPLPGLAGHPPVAVLQAPVVAIFSSGVVELADGAFCVLLSAAGTSWSLRSEEEQAALVEAFGRWLNSLSEPAAITVRSEPVDLAERASEVERAAPALPDPALRECARTYAQFLAQLAGNDLRRRQILLVLTTRARERQSARGALERRSTQAASLLRTAGVELKAIDGEQVAALLAGTLDSPAPPVGSRFDGVIHRC
jgi:PrgI family protein